MDVIYFLRIICKKKKLCLYPETVPQLGQSLEESLAGGGLVKNLKIFWMNDKTIIEFGFRMMWGIMQISKDVTHLGLQLDG